MALGQILAGNFINAVDLQDELDALEGRLVVRARSTAATTMSSSTSFVNLTGLVVALAASSVYKLRGRLKVTGANTNHDMKVQWTLPAGASVEWSLYAITTSQTANPVSVDMSSNTGSIARGTIGGTMTYVIEGIFTTVGTAGNAQLQGAQNTSDPGVLSFDAGSDISAQLWV